MVVTGFFVLCLYLFATDIRQSHENISCSLSRSLLRAHCNPLVMFSFMFLNYSSCFSASQRQTCTFVYVGRFYKRAVSGPFTLPHKADAFTFCLLKHGW